MNKSSDQFVKDENDESWKILERQSCPKEFAPRKHSFKVCFEVEFEVDLTLLQPTHLHVIAQRAGANPSLTIDGILAGDVRDFGSAACMERKIVTEFNTNLVRKGSVKDSNHTSTKRTAFDPFSYEIAEMLFRERIEYLDKHLPTRIMKLLSEISNRFDKKLKNSPPSSFDADSELFKKRVRDAKDKLRNEGKKITKTNVGRLLYGEQHTNPIVQLNRELNRFFLSFGSVLI